MVTRNLIVLVSKFVASDFSLSSAICTLKKVPINKIYTFTRVFITLRFSLPYDTSLVFQDLPNDWTASITWDFDDKGFLLINIVELDTVFDFHYTGLYSMKEAIQDEIDKLIGWLDDELRISILRLSGFWLNANKTS